MLAYWCAFGSNYIGGTGSSQSDMAWRLPMIIQGIPAVVLCIGLFFMPFSPRLLVNKGKDAEALSTLAYLRNLPEDHYLVQVEYLEIKADAEFEKEIFDKRFPELSKSVSGSVWRREFAQYSNIFRSRDNFKRVALASLVMFFQQWTGIDSSKLSVVPGFQTHTDCSSHLLRSNHIPISRSHRKHNFPSCLRSGRCHQRRYHNPSNLHDRPRRSQAPHDGRLRRNVHLRSHHWRPRRNMRSRLDHSRGSRLGSRRFRLAIHCQLRLLMGTRIMDPHR